MPPSHHSPPATCMYLTRACSIIPTNRLTIVQWYRILCILLYNTRKLTKNTIEDMNFVHSYHCSSICSHRVVNQSISCHTFTQRRKCAYHHINKKIISLYVSGCIFVYTNYKYKKRNVLAQRHNCVYTYMYTFSYEVYLCVFHVCMYIIIFFFATLVSGHTPIKGVPFTMRQVRSFLYRAPLRVGKRFRQRCLLVRDHNRIDELLHA